MAVLLLVTGLLAGCVRSVEGAARAAPAAPTPQSPQELERLLVDSVPSGLPRVADDQIHPPAGEKTVEDVAAYAADPARERQVLEDYGYRYGWERFWGHDGGSVTSVFVDQFEHRTGAGAYAEDLAGNDAERYSETLREDPPGLPRGCWSMTLEKPVAGLPVPGAFAWCRHGVFSVAVKALRSSEDAAAAEVSAVLAAQLDQLPPG